MINFHISARHLEAVRYRCDELRGEGTFSRILSYYGVDDSLVRINPEYKIKDEIAISVFSAWCKSTNNPLEPFVLASLRSPITLGRSIETISQSESLFELLMNLTGSFSGAHSSVTLGRIDLNENGELLIEIESSGAAIGASRQRWLYYNIGFVASFVNRLVPTAHITLRVPEDSAFCANASEILGLDVKQGKRIGFHVSDYLAYKQEPLILDGGLSSELSSMVFANDYVNPGSGKGLLVAIQNMLRVTLSTHDISLETLAKQIGIPKRQLQSQMKKTKYTYKQYVSKVRKAILKAEISCSGAPLSDIAFSCGYSSQSAMSSDFAKTEKVSANTYRNAMQTRYINTLIDDLPCPALSAQ